MVILLHHLPYKATNIKLKLEILEWLNFTNKSKPT